MFSLGEQFVIIGTYVVDLWHIGPNLSILQNHMYETCVQFNVSVQDVYSAFLHSTCGHMSKVTRMQSHLIHSEVTRFKLASLWHMCTQHI